MSRLFAAERAAAPPAGKAEAGLERLLESLASGTAPLAVGSGALGLGWGAFGKWLGIGFVVGIAGAGTAAFIASPNDAEPAPVNRTIVVAAPSVAPELPAAPRGVPASSSAPPLSSPLPISRAGSATRAEDPPSASSLEEELRLIARAKRDLDAGRPHLARGWLSEHQQRFPRGALSLEREGLSVLASCSEAPWPALAEQFASAYPGAPLLAQVRRRCAEAPSPGASVKEFSSPANANASPEEPTRQ